MVRMNDAFMRWFFKTFSLSEYFNFSRLRQMLPNSNNILSKKEIVEVVSFDYNRIYCISHWPKWSKVGKNGDHFRDPDPFPGYYLPCV